MYGTPIGTAGGEKCVPISNLRAEICKFENLPPHRIPHRVAKHPHEHGLQKRVAELRGVAARAAQAVCLVQQRGDAALFGERRKMES